jgi:hypothetical protein
MHGGEREQATEKRQQNTRQHFMFKLNEFHRPAHEMA